MNLWMMDILNFGSDVGLLALAGDERGVMPLHLQGYKSVIIVRSSEIKVLDNLRVSAPGL